MEGFLTLPFRRGDQWSILANYDHDKELGRNHIWDWRGPADPNWLPDNHAGTIFGFGANKGDQVSFEALYRLLSGRLSCDELIVASAPGVVREDPLMGDTGAGVRTQYLGYILDYDHLEEWYVKYNDLVARNQPIGKPACHARVSRPHLHFDLFEMGEGDPSDPSTIWDWKRRERSSRCGDMHYLCLELLS